MLPESQDVINPLADKNFSILDPELFGEKKKDVHKEQKPTPKERDIKHLALIILSVGSK